MLKVVCDNCKKDLSKTEECMVIRKGFPLDNRIVEMPKIFHLCKKCVGVALKE